MPDPPSKVIAALPLFCALDIDLRQTEARKFGLMRFDSVLSSSVACPVNKDKIIACFPSAFAASF